MEQVKNLVRHNQIMNKLNILPRKILSLHGYDNIPEFVLHDLCHPECFNLSRAAYFVDNPDFDCIKGIVGFSQHEAVPSDTIWQDPDSFTLIMQSSPFNRIVREYHDKSQYNRKKSDKEIAQKLAQDLQFVHPCFSTWTMKHDNHGILIYEASNQGSAHDAEIQHHLHNGVCLLGFCPIF